MDDHRFDRLVKCFSAEGTRRRVLAAVLGGTLGLLGLAGADAGRRTKNRGGVSRQGPCGNGSAKANACRRDGQCCTGYCHKKKGRCRCRKAGQSCLESRNCCATLGQPRSCQGGTCQTVQSGCVPATSCSRGQNCGTAPNGCGGALDCGICSGSAPVCDGTACRACAEDGECCGAPNGGMRCQGGSCVAAAATFPDCGARCNTTDSGSPIPADVTICGTELACPNCDDCPASCTGDARIRNGPEGDFYYCLGDATSGSCGACQAGSYCVGPNCGEVCPAATGPD